LIVIAPEMKRKTNETAKPFQILYVIYALLLFLVLMIPVFIWSVIVSLFGRIKGGNLIYKACMLWGDIWFALLFIRHKNIHETSFNKGKSYIFVANHISYFDTPALVKTFRQPVRPLGKVEMTKIPIFGFIYKRAIVTVDRSSAHNRANSVLLLKSILNKGISVLVFPEGTFNMTGKPLKSFYDGAFKLPSKPKHR
jgi:1-acyl-sn-glycerol-3-phosphate acyltransferase